MNEIKVEIRATTEFKDPEIKVVNQFDNRRDAWLFSKPFLDPETFDIKSIEEMDLPVVGFRHWVFEVSSSLLFRDILFTVRPIVPWARSNRTTPINNKNTYLSSEYKTLDVEGKLQVLMNEVYTDLANGIPQEYAKTKLPMATLTSYYISIDDRTLIAFLKSLQIHSKDLFNVYGELFLRATNRTVEDLNKIHSNDIWSKLAISDTELTNVNKTFTVMELFTGVFKLSNNLMAQFIRQHYSTIKNGLYNQVADKSLSDILTLRSNDETIVAVYADKQAFHRVLSIRSCWFAQWDHKGNDSWSAILDPFVKSLGYKEFLELLPCKGNPNNCSIKEDMCTKITAGKVEYKNGKKVTGDLLSPCPILLESPQIVNYRVEKYNSNSEVSKKWKELTTVEGIKDNPDNKYRKIYEENISKYGYLE